MLETKVCNQMTKYFKFNKVFYGNKNLLENQIRSILIAYNQNTKVAIKRDTLHLLN